MKFCQTLIFCEALLFWYGLVSVTGSNSGKVTSDASADTHFNLWTRKNPTVYQQLVINDTLSVSSSNYDHSKPTKFFIHGWLSNGYNDPAVLEMRDEFLKYEDCNYIAVDWEQLASNVTYLVPVANTQPVGILTGQFIDFLITQGSSYSQLHVIGFSLGAHVAGKAGAQVGGILPRISGLDPAFPGFTVENTDERLDTSDAQFVDVMHTNSEPLLDGGLSFPVAVGHVDFWPNGGISQPGCTPVGPNLIDIVTGCSHNRAPTYFIESINRNTSFIATKCSSYDAWKSGECSTDAQSSMGLHVSMSAIDNFYLDTNFRAPFSLS